MKSEQRKAMLSRRRKAFWNSINVACVVCGEREPIFIDFHHVDKKQWQVGFLLNRAIKGPQSLWPQLLEQELVKTIPLCCMCHRRFHHGLVALSEEQLAMRPHTQEGWMEWQEI
jgi:hypothetical protein